MPNYPNGYAKVLTRRMVTADNIDLNQTTVIQDTGDANQGSHLNNRQHIFVRPRLANKPTLYLHRTN